MKTDSWYRQPWPWLLMAGPAAVVIAGIFTAYLAVTTFDGFAVDPKTYKRPIVEAHPSGERR